MYIKKSSGPRMEPCGTPDVIGLDEELDHLYSQTASSPQDKTATMESLKKLKLNKGVTPKILLFHKNKTNNNNNKKNSI